RARRVLDVALVAAIALLGAFIGAILAPAAHAQVGPLTVRVDVRPSIHPGTQVQLAPFGSVRFDTHAAPVMVDTSIETVDVDQAQEVLNSRESLTDLEQRAPDELRSAVIRAGIFTALGALLGAVLLGGLASRSVRTGLESGALALVVVLVVGG